MKARFFFLASALIACGVAAACGSDPGATFPEPEDAGGRDAGNTSSTSGFTTADTGTGTSSSSGGFEECATAKDNATRIPLHLVLLVDRSSSMCCYDDTCMAPPPAVRGRDCNRADSRWGVLTQALSSFLQTPEAAGIMLSFLPFPAGGSAVEAQCTYDYSTGVIFNEQELPNAGLMTHINGAKPPAGGYVTPTTPAFEGALGFARSLRDVVPENERVAILLATDGQPKDCTSTYYSNGPHYPDGDVSTVASAAQNAAINEGISTYVLGLNSAYEDLTANVNAIATSAGTAPAAIVDVTNPAAASQAITDAINAIRARAMSCDLVVPAAPEGQTLDPQKVNVVYIPGDGGAERTLPYSPDCTIPGGWHYDNPTAPTLISLCEAVCGTVKDDPEGRIEVVLGCETQTDIVN